MQWPTVVIAFAGGCVGAVVGYLIRARQYRRKWAEIDLSGRQSEPFARRRKRRSRNALYPE